jgi:hypothetical protein
MKNIELSCYGIKVYISDDGGSIVSDLEQCEAHDAIESIVLAHACAGIDVESPAYIEGIETSIDAIANHHFNLN